MNIAKLNTASLDDKTFIIKKGGGGGSTPPSGGERNVRYYKAEDLGVLLTVMACMSTLYALDTRLGTSSKTILPPRYFAGSVQDLEENILGIAIDCDTEIYIEGMLLSLGDLIRIMFEEEGMSIDDIPTISKEEFYNLVK
jgi:hypothetical protein